MQASVGSVDREGKVSRVREGQGLHSVGGQPTANPAIPVTPLTAYAIPNYILVIQVYGKKSLTGILEIHIRKTRENSY
jgi:hypothetical protein